MAVVSQRLDAGKPQQVQQPAVDPKTGKLAPNIANNNKDLDVNIKEQDQGFFGSFWQQNKAQAVANKKRMSMMEAVSFSYAFSQSLICISRRQCSKLLVNFQNERR